MSLSLAAPITVDELNRATLARQLLLEPARSTIVEVIEHLVGLQAQAPFPPYTGLWTRLASFDPHELGAMLTNREVVRIVLMRSTIHLVTARDCLAIRPVLQPMLTRMLDSSNYRKMLPDADFDAITAHAVELMADATPTSTELGTQLTRRWPEYPPRALANVARSRLPLVQVPPRAVWGRSGATRVTTAQAWLGRELDDHHSPAPLIRRYLAAFGPARVADIQKWSGLTGLSEIVDTMSTELIRMAGPGGGELIDVPDAPRPAADVPAPVRFLAPFDNVLLSYADTSRIVDQEFRSAMMTVNGIVSGTVLVDGRVQALWSEQRTRSDAVVKVHPLRALTAPQLEAIHAEGMRMLATMAADRGTHDVRISEFRQPG